MLLMFIMYVFFMYTYTNNSRKKYFDVIYVWFLMGNWIIPPNFMLYNINLIPIYYFRTKRRNRYRQVMRSGIIYFQQKSIDHIRLSYHILDCLFESLSFFFILRTCNILFIIHDTIMNSHILVIFRCVPCTSNNNQRPACYILGMGNTQIQQYGSSWSPVTFNAS